jgi:hypothetical protein
LQSKQFWIYVTSFGKSSSTSIQLEVDGTYLLESYEVAETFAKHFQFVYKSRGLPLPSVSLAPVSNLDIF